MLYQPCLAWRHFPPSSPQMVRSLTRAYASAGGKGWSHPLDQHAALLALLTALPRLHAHDVLKTCERRRLGLRLLLPGCPLLLTSALVLVASLRWCSCFTSSLPLTCSWTLFHATPPAAPPCSSCLPLTSLKACTFTPQHLMLPPLLPAPSQTVPSSALHMPAARSFFLPAQEEGAGDSTQLCGIHPAEGVHLIDLASTRARSAACPPESTVRYKRVCIRTVNRT